jgi:hypothetical protein
MGSEEDSQGKSKPQDARTRSHLLKLAIFIGFCLGFMFAERAYIHYQEVQMSGGVGSQVCALKHLSSCELVLAG